MGLGMELILWFRFRVLKFFAVCFGLPLTFGQYTHTGQRHLSFGVTPRTL